MTAARAGKLIVGAIPVVDAAGGAVADATGEEGIVAPDVPPADETVNVLEFELN